MIIRNLKVVGSKMPRYRLFGDTVDVAGMMNTTGDGSFYNKDKLFPSKKYFAALKIHISLETKLLLDIHGCFKCEHRGAIDIKVSWGILKEDVDHDHCRGRECWTPIGCCLRRVVFQGDSCSSILNKSWMKSFNCFAPNTVLNANVLISSH